MTNKVKLAYDLAPMEFDDVILVLMNGAAKYEPRGWERGIKFEKETNLASIKRHINDYRGGNLSDSDSNLHPLLHVACRALMQYTIDKRTKMNKEEEESVIAEEAYLYGLRKLGGL